MFDCVGPPVAACATIAAGPYVWPEREPRLTDGRCPACPYAVPRRTRRRGGAVRGTAVPDVWGRRRAGTACACCAR